MNYHTLTRFMFHDRIPSNDNNGVADIAGLADGQECLSPGAHVKTGPSNEMCIRFHEAVRAYLGRDCL